MTIWHLCILLLPFPKSLSADTTIYCFPFWLIRKENTHKTIRERSTVLSLWKYLKTTKISKSTVQFLTPLSSWIILQYLFLILQGNMRERGSGRKGRGELICQQPPFQSLCTAHFLMLTIDRCHVDSLIHHSQDDRCIFSSLHMYW